MADALIEAPFGKVVLTAPVGAPGPISTADPRLPEGFRLNGCRSGVLEIAFSSHEVVEIEIACTLANGMKVTPAPGPNLMAWSVSGPYVAGAFAIRDLAWLDDNLGLERVSFAHAQAGVTLRLRARRALVAPIPFAAAWTLDPQTEAEETAALYAVDLALPAPL